MDEEKKGFIARSSAELGYLRDRFGLLQEEAKHSAPEFKIGFNNQLAELQDKLTSVSERIEALRETDDQEWARMRGDVEAAILDLKTALDVACTRF